MPTELLLPLPTSPEPGSRWRHHKGGLYTVSCICRHSEDPNHFFVIYQNENTREIWVRDYLNFTSLLDNGTRRFEEL